jgi:RHS repeat-associated protein
MTRQELARFALVTILTASSFGVCSEPATRPPTSVVVNRTLPAASAQTVRKTLSGLPDAVEIGRSRAFSEPLVPVGGVPSAEENAALGAAITQWQRHTDQDDFSSLTGFLEGHPQSPWRAALLVNLGLSYYQSGWYSRAMDSWERAWELSKSVTDPAQRRIADRAIGEFLKLNARVGRMDVLEARLAEIKDRPMSGPSGQLRLAAEEGLSLMKTRPEVAFRCGPLALGRILAKQGAPGEWMQLINDSKSTPQGISLRAVQELSSQMGMKLQIARRSAGAALLLPCVVHWKIGHYAALVKQEDNGLIHAQDPTFEQDTWLSQKALDAESSGYCLVPSGDLPSGWQAVPAEEAATVFGKGATDGNSPDASGDDGPADGGDQNRCEAPPKKDSDGNTAPPQGMARCSINLMQVGLNIVDEPVGYSPPVGYSVRFRVAYREREAVSNSSQSNCGENWTFYWLGYIQDTPSNASANVRQFVSGGGFRTYTGYNAGTTSFAAEYNSQSILKRVTASPIRYELTHSDGSVDVFTQDDGNPTSRRVFLTQRKDPFGNTLTLTYDGSLRLVALTDAIGQVTSLEYGLNIPGSLTAPNRITKVTDPFGRFSTLEYDASERLIRITDTIGLQSSFTYEPAGVSYRVASMTTPYGTHSFARFEQGRTRRITITDPVGEKEMVEFREYNPAIPASDPAHLVPAGVTNNYLGYRNTCHWGKIAMHNSPGDYTQCTIYHWLHDTNFTMVGATPECVKQPLESRVWYRYPGQTLTYQVGTANTVSTISRVLDSGETQTYTYQYNANGNLTHEIDPLGRQKVYVYATNGQDLTEVRQTTGPGSHDRLTAMTYNAQHLPLTRTDAAVQTTTYTYNARGQTATRTNALGHVTAYTYDANGYLTSIDGPLPGPQDTRTFTYDPYGRTRTTVDVDGYTRTFDYDLFDRPTRVTYPDGTYDERTYDRLKVATSRDRQGRVTSYAYNSLSQLAQVTDPLNRVLRYEWCLCGDIKRLYDPMGRPTRWYHDVQGRVVAKEYADGSKELYSYEAASGRLKRKTDPKGQFTDYVRNRDNTLASIRYPNAEISTPTVSYRYDPIFQRRISAEESGEVTTYSYHPVTSGGALGAAKLASKDGPLPDDTISYLYDAQGRRATRTVAGSPETWTYDEASRVTQNANALGSFSYNYDGATHRPISMTYPNGVLTTWSYYNHLGSHRLQQLKHARGADVIAQHDYTYLPAGNIHTWSQQLGIGASPVVFTYTYDAADQLLSADGLKADNTHKTHAYTYDPAGNRLSEAEDGNVRGFTYNALNELKLTSGWNLPATQYEWDGANRLSAINTNSERYELAYDADGINKSIVHKSTGVSQGKRIFLRDGTSLVSEYDVTRSGTKRFFAHGQTSFASNEKSWLHRDHLGSIVSRTNSAGEVQSIASYDPYGNVEITPAETAEDFGFTGHQRLGGSDLLLAPFRLYSTTIARWISRDLLNEKFWHNRYAYVKANPIRLVDPLGLAEQDCGCDEKLIQLSNCVTVEGFVGLGATITVCWGPCGWQTYTGVGIGLGGGVSGGPQGSIGNQNGATVQGSASASAGPVGAGVSSSVSEGGGAIGGGPGWGLNASASFTAGMSSNF